MKKIMGLLLSGIFLLTSLAAAIPMMDIGLGMGGFAPDNDATTLGTFGKSFYWQGMIGVVDSSSGFEVRGNWGSYADISHYSLSDQAANFRINVIPLTASLIYHLGIGSFIDPYLGGGIGGYFYSVKDDIYGTYESSMKFGSHALIGIKLSLTNEFYIALEYTKALIPAIYFTNAKNFDASALTLGCGFAFSWPESTKHQSTYKYTAQEEDLLVQIQQQQAEIKDLKLKHSQLEQEIDSFYEDSSLDEASPEFARALRKAKYQEGKLKNLELKISQAESNLSALQRQWNTQRTDNVPVEDHIVYIEKNYTHSPYGLSFSRGNFSRRGVPMNYYSSEPRASFAPPVVHAPAPPSDEEKKAYVERKRQRLQETKNR